MAVNALAYFSNSIQGIPQIGSDVNLAESRTQPTFAMGYRVQRQDGAEFVYASFGDAVAAGALCAQDISESGLVDSDNIVIAPASAVTTTDGTAGQKYLQVTLAATTVDQFAGGYLTITDDSGEGHTYRIKGNTATDDPTTGDIRIELKDKLAVALDATSDIAITGSLYANLESATTTDNAAAGVAVVAQAAGDFGWVQTKGVVGILTNGVIAVGNGVIIGAVAGSVAVGAAVTDTIIGTCIVVGDDTGYSQIAINLS